MFKGFQNTSRTNGFNGFPALNFQMNNEAYGFSGCTFWLDAAYGLNTQTDLAAVSLWKSRIGGVTFTQATAGNQPRLIVANASYNNLPTIDFFDGNRFMDSATTIPFPLSIVVVANYDTINTYNTIISTQAQDNYNLVLGGTRGGYTGFGLVQDGITAGISFQGTTDTASVKIGIITYTNVFVNNVNENTGNMSETLYRGFNRIGRYAGFVTTGLTGKIAEILYFNRTFTSTEASQLSERLNSKYAIY